jgi:hypothetical protein
MLPYLTGDWSKPFGGPLERAVARDAECHLDLNHLDGAHAVRELGYFVGLNTIYKIRMNYKGSGESGHRDVQIHRLYKENPCEYAGRRVFKMWMYQSTSSRPSRDLE